MKKAFFLLLSFSLIFANKVFAAQELELDLKYVLEQAAKNSPFLSVAKLRELAAEKDVEIARSKYFPAVKAESIYSKGFPGSSGALGIEGLIGSPYRSGPSAGFVGRQVIWDFGRTAHAVQASKYESELRQKETEVTFSEVYQTALHQYYECTLFTTQSELWEYLAEESAIITKEIAHFVDTGQRSIVDRYLSKAQTEEAISNKLFFSELQKQSMIKLAIIMGVANPSFSCPSQPEKLADFLNPNLGMDSSPLLARAQASAKVAQEQLEQEKSGLYPEITAVASYGYMQKARVVPRQDYAFGLGITLPILDLYTRGRINRAKVLALSKTEEIASEKQYLAENLAHYDKIIESSQVLMQNLKKELDLANLAFKIAKDRYFALEGQLMDLREAFRNLARVRTEIENTQSNLLQAAGAKALLLGSLS